MGWQPGQHLGLTIRDAAILLTASDSGGVIVVGRSAVGLPVSARQLCGVGPGSLVLLAALTHRGVIVIHSAHSVVRLLDDLHAKLLGDNDAH